jgi:Asp-tRNA(Asn)/Glu-tRNA(Gln) amidotransferase A subunit family amidase
MKTSEDQELTRMPAHELAGLIRARAVSPVEAVESYLRRIESVNPALNALVTHAPDAPERAREAAAAVMRGEVWGSLHGVPLTVKDTIDVRGLRATCGSRVRAGHVAEEDAPAVARLRAAGAIFLGTPNCPEFALDYTSENPVFGRTNNPHDLERTPGGSSGGCAAAVAACMTAGSLGSDLAGSIRIPANFCGVSGLKPTAAGRVPGGGQRPPATGLHSLGATVGPLARTVDDLRLFYSVLAGEREPQVELKGLRVAFYMDDGSTAVTAETREAVRGAASALNDAGLEVSEEIPPGVGDATGMWLSLFEYTTQRFVRASYAGREEEAGRAARVILERAGRWGEPPLEKVLAAWEERDRAREVLLRWMERTPLLVAPVGAVPAFRHEEFGRVEVEGRSVPTFRAFAQAHAANVFNLPAACVPAGRTAAGLPVGVQVVGRPHEEWRVLAAARAIEEALGGWLAPPEPLPNTRDNPL